MAVECGSTNMRSFRQSFAQQRLWFLRQLEPTSTQHNVVMQFSIEGTFHPAAMRKAFAAMIAGHSALRTCYRDGADGPQQWVESKTSSALQFIASSEACPQAQERQVRALVQAERTTVFDLEHGPVMRGLLFQRNPLHHELIISVHHISFDGRSGEIMLQDLAEGYTEAAARSQSQAQAQAAEAIAARPAAEMRKQWQYPDFAEAEPSLLPPDLVADQLAFWRGHLQDIPLQLQWPEGRRQQAAGTGEHRFTIDAALTASLTKFARTQRLSVFQTLRTLFSVWLHYLAEQELFLIGTDIHGRNLPAGSASADFRRGVVDMVGFFVNQLPLKCDLRGSPTLSMLFERSRRDRQQVKHYQHLPFDRLVSALAPERRSDSAPLFQVKLNYQPDRVTSRVFGEAVLTQFRIEQALGNLDLVLDIMHGPQGMHACIEYNRQLFSAQDIDVATALWLRLLKDLPYLLDLPLPEICSRLKQWDFERQHSRQQRHHASNRARLATTARRPMQVS